MNAVTPIHRSRELMDTWNPMKTKSVLIKNGKRLALRVIMVE